MGEQDGVSAYAKLGELLGELAQHPSRGSGAIDKAELSW